MQKEAGDNRQLRVIRCTNITTYFCRGIYAKWPIYIALGLYIFSLSIEISVVGALSKTSIEELLKLY